MPAQSPFLPLSLFITLLFLLLPSLITADLLKCYNATDPTPQKPPMTRTECQPIFDRINAYSGSTTSRLWTRENSPVSWSDSDTNCRLEVRYLAPPSLPAGSGKMRKARRQDGSGKPEPKEDQDYFTNRDVATAAQDMIEECFPKENPLRGGEWIVGPRGRFVAALFKTVPNVNTA